jgi:hypothetical protein
MAIRVGKTGPLRPDVLHINQMVYIRTKRTPFPNSIGHIVNFGLIEKRELLLKRGP